MDQNKKGEKESNALFLLTKRKTLKEKQASRTGNA